MIAYYVSYDIRYDADLKTNPLCYFRAKFSIFMQTLRYWNMLVISIFAYPYLNLKSLRASGYMRPYHNPLTVHPIFCCGYFDVSTCPSNGTSLHFKSYAMWSLVCLLFDSPMLCNSSLHSPFFSIRPIKFHLLPISQVMFFVSVIL